MFFPRLFLNSHRNLFAFHHASIACPLSFSLFLPLHKPYVTDMEGFMGMGFKDILVWLRSHLAEIVFLLIVLVVLLLMGYWAWAATPRAKDSFPCSSKKGTSVYPPRIEQCALKTD
jgi:hypothetical protein